MRHLKLSLLAGLLPALFAVPVLAAEDWSLCRIPSFEYIQKTPAGLENTTIEAQYFESFDGNSLRLTGNVELTRQQQNIRADNLVLDKSTDILQASGNVRFVSPDYRLKSPDISVDNHAQTARFEQVEFELPSRHISGEANSIEQLDDSRSRFSDLIYTACDRENRDWHLRASDLEIDNESGRGSATHTTIYFKDVPFLYLPYFQFPIDNRRLSGLLAPSIGFSESHGVNIIAPIYWNLATNYDATITPAFFSERGLQLNTENRYLFEQNQGQLELSYLDDDELQQPRWFQQWQHKASFDHNIEAKLLWSEVSDDEFFDDFINIAPQYSDTRHLERYFSLTNKSDSWTSSLRWQNYQTIDESTSVANRPYQRLPELTLTRQPLILSDRWTLNFQAEWVSFERDQSVTGKRSHLSPSIRWQSTESWYFFKPELLLSLSDYQLDSEAGDDSIQRSLPTLSIDNGLIFERFFGDNSRWTQTLEPRLFFLFTPHQDQQDIPNFDTSLASQSYTNLFRTNRFVGADRIGDANQVSAGLSSRIYHSDSSQNLLHARIGQIFYAEKRRVSLNGVVDEAPKSDAIAELDVWFNPYTKLNSRVVYSSSESQIADRDISINYARDGLAANLGYYFSEGELEQGLVSMVYPLNEKWTLIAKYHESLIFNRPVDNLLGLSYESCCWGLKILAGQSGDVSDNFAETDNSIYFELTLKGLSQAGTDIDAQLAAAIPGYRSNF